MSQERKNIPCSQPQYFVHIERELQPLKEYWPLYYIFKICRYSIILFTLQTRPVLQILKGATKTTFFVFVIITQIQGLQNYDRTIKPRKTVYFNSNLP